MGTCEDMCPPEERQKRQNESDIHKLEIPHADMTPGRPDFSLTMVKKFQRSSADHALQIPHLLRTPDALLRTIGECTLCAWIIFAGTFWSLIILLFPPHPEYIENELMDRAAASVFDPRIGEAPTTLFIYLFVWDRCVHSVFSSSFISDSSGIHCGSLPIVLLCFKQGCLIFYIIILFILTTAIIFAHADTAWWRRTSRCSSRCFPCPECGSSATSAWPAGSSSWTTRCRPQVRRCFVSVSSIWVEFCVFARSISLLTEFF